MLYQNSDNNPVLVLEQDREQMLWLTRTGIRTRNYGILEQTESTGQAVLVHKRKYRLCNTKRGKRSRRYLVFRNKIISTENEMNKRKILRNKTPRISHILSLHFQPHFQLSSKTEGKKGRTLIPFFKSNLVFTVATETSFRLM